MLGLRSARWRAAGFWIGVAAVVAAVGLAIVMVAGVYNVGADVRHFSVTNRLIEFVIERSVATHSIGIEPPDLEDEGLIRLGASHYRLGCAPCHGSPGSARNPIVTSMYPAPPQLGEAAQEWDAEELYWIVLHGLKFSGMPAWSGEARDDEVWPVVAFLRRLPGMDGAAFEALTGLAGDAAAPSAHLDFGQEDGGGAAACAACHGDARSRPISDEVPALHGQKAAYLRRALAEYRADRRQSGIMEPAAAALAAGAVEELVRDYAAAPRPEPEPAADAESVRRGREIAHEGVPGAEVPACLACHSERTSEQFPLLTGLSQAYTTAQLALWREGLRGASVYGAIMGAIAPRLTEQQIADVTAYFAALPAGDGQSASGAEPAAP